MGVSILILSISFFLFYLGTQFLIQAVFTTPPENDYNFTFSHLLKFSILLSTPAFMIGLASIVTGDGGLVTGCLLGSNFFNLSVILGISAFIRPVNTSMNLNKCLILLLIGCSLIILFIFNDRVISRMEGGILLLIFILFATYNLLKQQSLIPSTFADTTAQVHLPARKWSNSAAYFGAGVFALVTGTWLLIANTRKLSMNFGFSSTQLGFIIVSAGIGIPLFINALRSNAKGRTEMVIGIVFLTSILNILVVLGISSLVKPVIGYAISNFDLYAFVGFSLFQVQLLRKKFKLKKDEALFQIIVYLMFLYYLLPK